MRRRRDGTGRIGIELVAPAPPVHRRRSFSARPISSSTSRTNRDLSRRRARRDPSDEQGKAHRCSSARTARVAPQRCTTRTKGRIVEINPAEELLAAARGSAMDRRVQRALSRTCPRRTQERTAQVPHTEDPLARPCEGRRLGEDPSRGAQLGPDGAVAGIDRMRKGSVFPVNHSEGRARKALSDQPTRTRRGPSNTGRDTAERRVPRPGRGTFRRTSSRGPGSQVRPARARPFSSGA